MSGAVVSVRVGKITAYERPAWDHVKSRPYTTAFRKAEVTGPVHVGPLGLEGDEQADKKFHGGPEMAVLMYADAHYATLLQGFNYYGALSGEQMTRRYFGTQAGGTAKMLVTGAEYNVAWGRLLRYPVELSPNGPDVFSSFFVNFASVDSKDPDFDGRKFLKFGTELTWRWQRWLAFTGRVDRVIPNSKDPLESFTVICPRILLKTDWLSHETVTIAYTRWFYGAHTHTEFPNAYSPGQLDEQMLSLTFGLWF